MSAAFVLAGVALAAPASADTGPDLKVTATVAQGRWLPGDAVPVDLTITNVGDRTDEGVRGYSYRQSGAYLYISDKEWGDLAFQGPGTTFAPGETRTYHLHGSVDGKPEEGDPTMQIGAIGTVEADNSDNAVVITVPLVPPGTTDRVAGHLSGIRDGRPPQALAGAEAHLIGSGMSHDLVSVTDATGAFSFDGLPAGSGYSLHFEKMPGGWVVQPVLPQLRLDGSGANTALRYQAIRPLTDVLKETITLGEKSYAVGDTGTATVTLTNVGTRPLSDLYLGCDPGDGKLGLQVPNEQLGAFSPEHPAGTLAAGQRVVLHVSGKVPEKAEYYGQTGFDCYADDSGKTYDSGPYTYAHAKVPGVKSDARGEVFTDKNGNGYPDTGEGVANTRIALLSDDGRVVAQAQTDADGFATFANVSAGLYRARVSGPWRPSGSADVGIVAPPYSLGPWTLAVTRR